MLSTLDRHIARQYLVNVVALMLLLFSFVVAVDVALNIDRYIDTAAALAAAGRPDGEGADGPVRRLVVMLLLVADLWWPRLLQLYNFMIGLLLVGGMGFTLSQMSRTRELSACMAGGISLRRLARPFLLVAVLLTGLQVVNQEFVLPRIAPLLTRDHKQAGRRDVKAFAVLPTRDSEGRVLFAREFDPRTATVKGLRVWERDAQGRATRQIDAREAVWENGSWRLEDSTIRNEDVGKSSAGAGRGPENLATDVDPTWLLLRRYQGLSASLSWSQLADMLRSGRLDHGRSEELSRIQMGRVSTIACNFLSLLICMPYFLLREPRNLVTQSLKCAPVAMVSLMGAILGAAAPIPGLPAAFAVFLPALVLTPVAIASWGWVRT